MPNTDPYPRVAGRCPACGMTTLFLGEGGHVTCGLIAGRDGTGGCSDPCAADDLLHAAAPIGGKRLYLSIAAG